jgi:hypothetical protein
LRQGSHQHQWSKQWVQHPDGHDRGDHRNRCCEQITDQCGASLDQDKATAASTFDESGEIRVVEREEFYPQQAGVKIVLSALHDTRHQGRLYRSNPGLQQSPAENRRDYQRERGQRRHHSVRCRPVC